MKVLNKGGKPKRSALEEQLEACTVQGACTFLVTQKNFAIQRWYQCAQCGLTGSRGCCKSCYNACHKGHWGLTKGTTTRFYCDCYEEKCCQLKEKEFERSFVLFEHEIPEVDETFSSKGIYYFKNGGVYAGDWLNGKMNGEGNLTIALGSYSKYNGEMVENRMEGRGEFTLYSTYIYQGDVKNNKPNGNGVILTEKRVKIFEGEFVDGKKCGFGRYYYNSGKLLYEGCFSNNAWNGRGISYNKNGTVIQLCDTWKDGKRHGVVFIGDGSRYYQKIVYYDGISLGEIKSRKKRKTKVEETEEEEEEESGEEEETSSPIFSIRNLSDEQRDDKLFICSVLEVDGSQLAHVKENFKMDSQIILSAITKYPEAILQAHEMYRKERSLVEEIVSKNGKCLYFLDEIFRNDNELILLAVKQNGLVIQHYDREYQKKNISIVMESVKQNGRALKYCHLLPDDDLSSKMYRKICSTAVKNDPMSLRYVKQKFCTRKIVKKAIDTLQTLTKDITNLKKRKSIWIDFFECLLYVQMKNVKWITDKILTKFISKPVVESELVLFADQIRRDLISNNPVLSTLKLNYWLMDIKKEAWKSCFQLHPLLSSTSTTSRKSFSSTTELSQSRDHLIGFLFQDERLVTKKNHLLPCLRRACGQGLHFRLTSTRKKQYRILFSGSFLQGKREGEGIEYSIKNGAMIFEGGFRQGKREGCGREYYQSFGKFNIIEFEGQYSNGEKNGRGEYTKGGKVIRGNWMDGILDEKSVVSFDCPLFDYDKISKQLKNASIIGSGAFGIVYKVKSSSIPGFSSKNRQFVAVKIMKCRSIYHISLLYQMTKRGIGLCCNMKRHILSIYGIIRGGREVGYIMECGKITVAKLIEASNNEMKLEDKIRILHETAMGMKELHENLVMHRDLKWQNILLGQDDVVKITDFDTLKEDELKWRIRSVANSSSIGTPGFIAPEVFLGKQYSLSCDVYAFGLMIYSILWEVMNPYSTKYQCNCGIHMENVMLSNSLDFHVANCNLRPEITKSDINKYPKFLIEIMIMSLERDPFKRPTFLQIVRIFENELSRRKKEEKCYAVLTLQFTSTSSYSDETKETKEEKEEIKNEIKIKDQKMLLDQPKRKVILNWIEKKFYGSKVINLTNKMTGESIEEDSQVFKMIQEYENPIIEVKLDRIRQESLEDSLSKYRIGNKVSDDEELDRLKKENEDLVIQVNEVNGKNEMLEMKISEMMEKMKSMEEEIKILKKK